MNAQRILDDYAMVEGTEFWRYFLEQAKKSRDSKAKMLENVKVDELARFQGELAGMDLITGLPEKIYKDAKGQKT